MNIQQIKEDLANDVIVSRSTIVKLADAALMMEDYLTNFVNDPNGHDNGWRAALILKQIKEM